MSRKLPYPPKPYFHVPPHIREALLWLKERGGVCYISRSGRIMAQDTASRIPAEVWLMAVQAGYIEARDKHLHLTDKET